MPRRAAAAPASRYQRQLHYGNHTKAILSGLRNEREKAALQRQIDVFLVPRDQAAVLPGWEATTR